MRRAALAACVLVAASCAAKRPALPAGPGTAFPDFASALDQATAACRDVASMTATMALSGRSGSTKLRGRIDAGLASPGRLRLEGYPPVIYGSKPYFILVAAGNDATLWLPRDNRVLRDAAPDAIVDALAGVPLAPDDLRSVVAGCGLPGGPATSGRTFDGAWAAVDQGGTTAFLRQLDGRWRLAASTRGAITIQYLDFDADRARTVNVRTSAAGRRQSTDMTLRLSDVEIGVPLEDRIFDVQVPPGALPLTLDQLRQNGPLGASR